MIIARQGPGVNFVIGVGAAIAVGIVQARQFTALGYVNVALFVGQTQGFVQTVGEALVGRPGLAANVGIRDNPDFAPARTNGQITIW